LNKVYDHELNYLTTELC